MSSTKNMPKLDVYVDGIDISKIAKKVIGEYISILELNDKSTNSLLRDIDMYYRLEFNILS